jgi:hypothetical protein
MSKKSTQKPTETKAEKSQAVEGTVETTAQEAPALEQVEASNEQPGDNAVNEPAEQNPEDAKAEESDDETAAAPALATEPAAAKASDEAESTPLPSAPVIPPAPTDLANRLTLAVRAIVATGAPEAVHALHKAELILGDLRNALPAAIASAGDEQLKADLTSLLAVL